MQGFRRQIGRHHRGGHQTLKQLSMHANLSMTANLNKSAALPRFRPQLSLVLLALLVTAACCGKQTTGPIPPPPLPDPTELKPVTGDLYHRPHVTLVAVTDWQGVLKPCGCTVDLQKGGIERIAKYVDDLREQDDSVLVVHAGSLLAEQDAVSGPRAAQLPQRLQAFSEALERIQVGAVALSSFDLDIGGQTVKNLYEEAKWPVLALGGGERHSVRSTMATTKSGVSVGLVAIDPRAADDDAARNALLGKEIVGLRSQRVQIVVVLSNLGLRASRKLARAVPGIDAMVVGQLDEKIEPELDLEREGDTLIVHAARHGAWFSALTLVPSLLEHNWKEVSEFLPGTLEDLDLRIAAIQKTLTEIKARGTVANAKALPFIESQLADMQKRRAAAAEAKKRALPAGALAAYRTIGLPWTAATDPEVAKIVADYDARVAEANVKAAGEVPKPEAGQASYVGQATCLQCHSEAEDFVAHDMHQHAWATLEKAGKAKDLDCVACHATGFGQAGGSNLAHLDGLTNVTCESCHGPGSLHVSAPSKVKPATIKPDQAVCTTCHTTEHAPRFEFLEYRKRLIVPGHGMPLARAGGK